MNDFVRSPKRGAFHMGLDVWMIEFGLAPKLGAFHMRLDDLIRSRLQAWGISYGLG